MKALRNHGGTMRSGTRWARNSSDRGQCIARQRTTARAALHSKTGSRSAPTNSVPCQHALDRGASGQRVAEPPQFRVYYGPHHRGGTSRAALVGLRQSARLSKRLSNSTPPSALGGTRGGRYRVTPRSVPNQIGRLGPRRCAHVIADQPSRVVSVDQTWPSNRVAPPPVPTQRMPGCRGKPSSPHYEPGVRARVVGATRLLPRKRPNPSRCRSRATHPSRRAGLR